MTRHPYGTPLYAAAFGMAYIDVPEWRTSVLVRPIPGAPWSDALGCYPLAALHRDADLRAGLERLRAAGLVSVCLVPDPLTGPAPEALARAFPMCRPFKTHYVIDWGAGALTFGATHRRKIRKALKACTVEVVDLGRCLDDWVRLYGQLVRRHGISGIQDFEPAYFAALADMRDVTALTAWREGRVAAMGLWVRSGGIAYCHLGASSPAGYQAQAMYGIYAAALDHFADCEIFHLGGGAGTDGASDGLVSFKRGFANREVTAHLCGARLAEDRYATLTAGRPPTPFFPEYRCPP